MDLLVTVLLAWLILSFLNNFVNNYKEIAEERAERDTIKLVLLQIQVEQHKGLWYGWHIDDEDRETFVAQGNSYSEAVANCKKHIETKNPDYRVLFKFTVKRDEQPALQN